MFRAEFLWISVLLAIGAIGGLVYNWPASVDETQTQATQNVAQPAASSADNRSETDRSDVQAETVRENPQAAVAIDQADQESEVWSAIASPSSQIAKQSQPIDFGVVGLGDGLLLGGNSLGAYQYYTKLWQQSSLPIDSAVLIRMGLASELAGLGVQAEEHYRSAIRVAGKRSPQQIASLLGTARIWERDGHLDEAIALLSELYLLYGHDRYPDAVRHLIFQQLANCLQQRLLNSPFVAEALIDEPMQYHWCPIVPGTILALADWDSPIEPNQNTEAGLKLLQNPGHDVALILVQTHIQGVSMIKLIADLETLVGMKFEITDKAKSALVGRVANIDAPVMPLSMMLDQMLEPMLCVWTQADSSITIHSRDELTSRDAASYDLTRTQRMLQQVQLHFANGVERSAAIMNAGNNARLAGGWDAAAEMYRSARETNPTHELNAQLYFNEATLGLTRDAKLEALHACYMALDQTQSASFQSQIYSLIADLELEFGQPSKAILAASRGLRRGEDPQLLGRIAMSLARAYLLSDDPFSANAVLFDAADNIQGQSIERLASVFSTFARFQHVRPKHGLQDEGQRLLIALAALRPNDISSFQDALIVSKAYSAVGFRTKAIDNLEAAIKIAPTGYWSERMRLQLAEMYFESKALDQANATLNGYESVSADLLPTVLLLQSSIHLELGDLEKCERNCRQILELETIDEQQKALALEKLGETLQAAGDHYAAALCFAGLLPEQSGPLQNIAPTQTVTP